MAAKLKQSISLLFLASYSFLFILLRFPSLFEPNWYGDEGIYQVIGFGLNHGRFLYEGVWDNKPPMLYIIYALFNGDQFYTRLAGVITGVIAVWLFYLLVRILFKKPIHAYLGTILFTVLFGIPLLEGNIANAENFMVPFTLGAAVLIAQYVKQKSISITYTLHPITYFSAGALLSISFLLKIVAVFDLAAFSVIIFITQYKNKKYICQQLVRLLPFWFGFILPILLTIIFFWSHNALQTFIHSAFLSNIGYVNYANEFIIPQGFLIIRLILLIVFCYVMFLLRRRISHERMFIYIWMAFSLFGAFLSGRPYTHYMLVMLSSFCLFTITVFEKRKLDFPKTFIYIALILFIHSSFSFYNKTFSYYENFLSFVQNKKSVRDYYAFFDGATPRDYDLAGFLQHRLSENDTVFIWGNNGQLYRLLEKNPPGRFIVAYHIRSGNNWNETKQIVEKAKPRFVIVMPDQGSIPYPLLHYRQKAGIDKALIYEKIN